MLLFEHEGPNTDGSKLREIENLWKAIPPYDNAIETTSTTMASGRKASLSKYYKLDAEYDDLKDFYHNILIRHGWRMNNERSVTDWWRDKGGKQIIYQQGEYTLDIQYAGKKADYGWDYAIGIGWGAGSR